MCFDGKNRFHRRHPQADVLVGGGRVSTGAWLQKLEVCRHKDHGAPRETGALHRLAVVAYEGKTHSESGAGEVTLLIQVTPGIINGSLRKTVQLYL